MPFHAALAIGDHLTVTLMSAGRLVAAYSEWRRAPKYSGVAEGTSDLVWNNSVGKLAPLIPLSDGVLVYQLKEKMSKKVCAHQYIYVHINIY